MKSQSGEHYQLPDELGGYNTPTKMRVKKKNQGKA
jgi:hypothetical protein